MWKINKQRGITLLELLLVIAVLAAMSVAGISYLREKALNAKIDKTALQMQMWMQAAIAYHHDNGKWPTSADVQAMMPTYMPENSDKSVWFSNAMPQIGLYSFDNTLPKATRTDLTLELPDISGISGTELANRISGKLPFAKVNGSTVYATVNLPGAPGPAPGLSTFLQIIPGEFRAGAAYVQSDPESNDFDKPFTKYLDEFKLIMKDKNICQPEAVKAYLQLTGFTTPRVWVHKDKSSAPMFINSLQINQGEKPKLVIDYSNQSGSEVKEDTVNIGTFMATIVCSASESI